MRPEKPPLTDEQVAAWHDSRYERAGFKASDIEPLAPEGYVYFIKAGVEGPVKIGWATNPDERLAELQVGNHLTLSFLGTTEGSMTNERALHKKLKAHRVRGEWFEDCPDLRWLMHSIGASACRHTREARLHRAIGGAHRRMAVELAEEVAEYEASRPS